MKKAGLLKLLSAVTLAAAGLFGSVALKESSKAESVDAWSWEGTHSVAGSFNNWNTTANPLTNSDSTHATCVMYLDSGNYEFKIILNDKWLSMNNYGWHKDWSGSTNIYENNGNMSLNANASNSRVEATFSVVLSGNDASLSVSQKAAYTLTFNSAGGSSVASIEKGSGATIAKPTNPTRSGFTFDGWYDGNTAVSWPYTLTSNKTLTAHWTAVTPTHTVTYNAGGASGTVPTQPVVAEGGTFTVASYGNLMKDGKEFTGWSDGSTIYQPGSTYTMGQSNVTLTAQWTDMVTGKVYFTNNFKWDNVSQFSVVTEGVAGSRNYGVTKAYTNENSEDIYYATIPIHNSFRFTNSYDSTVFISGWVENRAYYLLNTQTEGRYNVGTWTVKPYTISYQGNGSTSGSMSAETAYANVTWGLTSNAFAKTGHVFDSWNTRADGTGTKYANGALLPQDVVATGATITLYAQWRISYTSGRYIVNGDLNMANARLMTYTNNQYVATVTLAYKENFKSGWYDDGTGLIDNYYGYSRLYSGCGAYHYFSVDEADNIVCYARGTYIIYVNDNNISIELQNPNVLTSEHLAAQLMSFGSTPSTGHCGDNDRFPAMKSIYLNKLNATEKSTFQSYVSSSEAQFKNAYDRYVAWARALGENPWAEGKANNAALLLGVSAKTTSNVVIIVVISLVSLSAIGGYFYLRRRKASN